MEQIKFMEGGEQAQIDTEQMAVAGLDPALNGHNPSNRDRPGSALAVADADTCPAPAGETVPARPGVNERNGRTLANVYTDPTRHTVSLLLDDRTANAVVYAVRWFAADLEARAREARLVSAMLPAESYGAVNRLAIAGRHERLAGRLRVLEGNYRAEVSGGWTPRERQERE